MRWSLIAAAAALLFGVGATAMAQNSQDSARPAGQEQGPTFYVPGSDSDFDPDQPIRGGMTVSINTSSAAGPEQDLSGVYPVDASGSVQLKLVGVVSLKGLTPSQAADKLAVAMRQYVRDPKVSVSITSVPKPTVFMGGAVTRAGVVAVNDNTTLAELLSVMGFSENGDFSRVRVMSRDTKGVRTTKVYDLLRWLKPAPGQEPDDAHNPVLTDRDSVFVPMKVVPSTGNVEVEGDVLRPGVVPLRVGLPLTLREAVSLAGGPNPTADRREISVRRMGVERAMVIDYERMESGDPTHNIPLMSDDVVYVRKIDVDSYITLNGAFIKPGKLPYNRPLTITEAVAEAGGLSPVAKVKDGRVFRHVTGKGDPTETQIIAFNYNDIRKNKQPDIRLEPGDTIEVPMGDTPRPKMDPLQMTSAILSLALIVDSLFGGGRRYY